MDLTKMITDFLCDDVGGILIIDEDGSPLYEDSVTSQVDRRGSNWSAACPPLREGQRADSRPSAPPLSMG